MQVCPAEVVLSLTFHWTFSHGSHREALEKLANVAGTVNVGSAPGPVFEPLTWTLSLKTNKLAKTNPDLQKDMTWNHHTF